MPTGWTRAGEPTFERVMRGLRLLQKHGVEYNILVTVNRVNADHPLEVYRFFRDEVGTSWMQFIPAIERERRPGRHQEGTVSERSVAPGQWGDFLTAIFDEWVRNDVGRVFVQTFEAAVRNWLGLGSSGMCVFDPTCGHGLALEHNGDLYACDHFVEPDYLLGNILQTHMAELAVSERQQIFGRDKRDTPAADLPRMRGPLCLPWGMPQKPVSDHPGRRTRAELPVCGLQTVFPARRPAPEDHGPD